MHLSLPACDAAAQPFPVDCDQIQIFPPTTLEYAMMSTLAYDLIAPGVTDTPHRPLVVNLSKLEECARESGGNDQVDELRHFFAGGWSVFHLYKAIPKRLRLQNKFNDGGYNGAAFLHRKRRQLVIGKRT